MCKALRSKQRNCRYRRRWCFGLSCSKTTPRKFFYWAYSFFFSRRLFTYRQVRLQKMRECKSRDGYITATIHSQNIRPKVSKTFGVGDPSGITLRGADHWSNLGVEFTLGT